MFKKVICLFTCYYYVSTKLVLLMQANGWSMLHSWMENCVCCNMKRHQDLPKHMNVH